MYGIVCFCVLIMFSLHRESLKLILLELNVWYCMLLCVDYVLTSSRITQADPG
jgi:hypothetical protein